MLRSYGCKVTMATQDLEDFIRVFGPHAMQTIISETHIKQFLSGIQSKTTMEFLSKYLGNRSETASNFSLGKENIQESVSSFNRALLNPDEIRTLDSDSQIILKGNLKPILARKTQVFAIEPWRKEIDPNPMYGVGGDGKGIRYLKPVEVIIGKWWNRVTKRGRFYVELSTERFPIWKFSWFLFKKLFPSVGIILLAMLVWLSFTQGLPHIRTSYSYSGSWSNPVSYHWCWYWGLKPFTTRRGLAPGGKCPVVVFRKVW